MRAISSYALIRGSATAASVSLKLKSIIWHGHRFFKGALFASKVAFKYVHQTPSCDFEW